MSIMIDPTNTSAFTTYRQLLNARHQLDHLQHRLHALRTEPQATPAMFAAIGSSITKWTLEARTLRAQNDAELDRWYAMINTPSTESETVTIDGETFVVVTVNVDVPGTVTHRQVARRQPGESFDQTVQRLLAKAIVEGLRLLYRPGDETYFYVESASGPHTLHRVNRETLHCGCPASGLCKHVILAAIVTEQIDRLSALYRHRPAA